MCVCVFRGVKIHRHLYRHRRYRDDHFSASVLYGCSEAEEHVTKALKGKLVPEGNVQDPTPRARLRPRVRATSALSSSIFRLNKEKHDIISLFFLTFEALIALWISGVVN